MNDINFVSTFSRQQQHAMQRWLIISVSASSLIITGMLVLQLYQWYTVRQLEKQRTALQVSTNDFEMIMNKKQALTQQKEKLEKQHAKLSRRINSPKLPIELMAALKSLTGTTVQLQSINLEKDTVRITAIVAQPAQATQFAIVLKNKAPVKDVRLLTMKNITDNNQIQTLFTLEAKVTH